MSDAPSFLDELSTRQKDILAALKAVIEKSGATDYEQSVEGQHETYVLIQNEHLKIFIFENGESQLKSADEFDQIHDGNGVRGAIDESFELSDYPDYISMKSALLSTLHRLLTTH